MLYGGARFRIKGRGSVAACSAVLKPEEQEQCSEGARQHTKVPSSPTNPWSVIRRSATNPYPQKLWITLWTAWPPKAEKPGHIAYL